MSEPAPESIDLKKREGLRLVWADGTESWYPIAYLRRMSPSADMVELREHMRKNPLTVMPSGRGGGVFATDAELVGNYAIKIEFSDGHRTGIYSWSYLREIDPDRKKGDDEDPRRGGSHADPLGLG